MTIHHIYITAGGFLWLYVLLCLLGKLQADRLRARRLRKRRAFISRFFSPGTNQADRVRDFKKLSRLVRDDLLLDYACDRYLTAAACCAPEELSALETSMKRLFHLEITQPGRSAASRCLLLADLQRCGFSSARFDPFLQACGSNSVLEQQWVSRLLSRDVRNPEPVR